MVAKDLLMTKISQTDARYKEVSLTEKGMELFEIMQSNCAHTGNQLLSNIGDRDRERFLFLVTQAIDNLKKANESSRGVANDMKGWENEPGCYDVQTVGLVHNWFELHRIERCTQHSI